MLFTVLRGGGAGMDLNLMIMIAYDFCLCPCSQTKVQNIKKRSDFSFSGQWDVVVESDEKQETLVFGGILVCSGCYLSTYHFSPSQVCHKNQLSGKVLAK